MGIAESVLMLSLIGGSNYADYASTQGALRRGGVELNGVMATPGRALAVKGLATGIEFGVIREVHKAHKKTAWFLAAGVVAGNLVIANHNRHAVR